MKSKTISRLLDYYSQSEEFEGEIKRAIKDFFGVGGNNTPFEINEGAMSHFNEWLVYDFVLKSGKSLLEDFYDRNPCNLSESDLKTYKDLQDNEYGMFEALKVEKGRGLELLSLQSGKKYFVEEFMGTFQISKGNIIPARVGRVGDRWELTSGNSLLFNIKIDRGTREYFLGAKDKITPKTICDIFLSGKEASSQDKNVDFEKEEEKLSLKEIEERLEEELEYLGINKCASAILIKKWISDLHWKRNENVPSVILSMLVGLISIEYDDGDLEKLAFLVGSLYNFTPQKNLGNKSPNEMREKKSVGKSGARMSITVLGSNEWLEYSEKASEFMQNNKNKQALEHYNKCFETLLKEKTTNPEIYRIFANKAITHFALGEERKGVRLLEIALKLNPNYDFGRDALKRYENGECDNLMLLGSLEGLARGVRGRIKKFENDPAIVYFNYLEKFNINFSTKELTVSDITVIGPDGKVEKIKGKRKKISRNDPCFCGSGKKYKKCCGR